MTKPPEGYETWLDYVLDYLLNSDTDLEVAKQELAALRARLAAADKMREACVAASRNMAILHVHGQYNEDPCKACAVDAAVREYDAAGKDAKNE